jgi:hypothetical protein
MLGLAAGTSATTLDDIALKGPIDKGGRAEIAITSATIQGTRANRYRWEFRRISVRCSGKRETSRLPVAGGFSVSAEFDQVGKPWGITGTASGGPHGVYRTKVSGRLVSRSKARGWVRVYGSDVAIRGGGRHEKCESGRLHWVAREHG